MRLFAPLAVLAARAGHPKLRVFSRPAGPLSEQNIKDRYYGVNDPVAEKLLARAAKLNTLTPPEDRTICTLFVGGVTGALLRGLAWLGVVRGAAAAGASLPAAGACGRMHGAQQSFPGHHTNLLLSSSAPH